MKKAKVIIANIHKVSVKPIIDDRYPTNGIRADIIIIDELKNDVAVPISSTLKVVLAICKPRVHEIPPGIPAIRNAKMRNTTDILLRAKKIAAKSAMLTAKRRYGFLFIIGDFNLIINLVTTSPTNIAASK